MNLEILQNFFKLLGLNVELNDSTSPLLLFACVVFVLSFIALLCFINILFYFTVFYITEHKIFLDKISKYTFLLKIVNWYKKMRLAYVIFDILLFLVNMIGLLWFSFKLIKVFI